MQQVQHVAAEHDVTLAEGVERGHPQQAVGLELDVVVQQHDVGDRRVVECGQQPARETARAAEIRLLDHAQAAAELVGGDRDIRDAGQPRAPLVHDIDPGQPFRDGLVRDQRTEYAGNVLLAVKCAEYGGEPAVLRR